MTKFKPYILPAAIVLGLLLHRWVAPAAVATPYIIFAILLLNFAAVNLRSLSLNRLDVAIMLFQAVVSVGGYALMRLAGVDEVLAQGLLLGVLCPVASSVVVISSELGADRRITTGYTIYGNLLVVAMAPVCFSFIGTHQDMPFWESAWTIFRRIASVIALPFFVALALQVWAPGVKERLASFKGWALPLWAVALLLTLGQTIDYIFLYHRGNERNILWLAAIAVALCAVQFGVGKVIGTRLGDRVAGGQLLGQKNTAFGIWMASVYLLPLSSVILAFYSIAQNLFNSYQLYRHTHRPQ